MHSRDTVPTVSLVNPFIVFFLGCVSLIRQGGSNLTWNISLGLVHVPLGGLRNDALRIIAASGVAFLESAPAAGCILVLPVDMFFGYADHIIDLAQNTMEQPTFFFAPDWVQPTPAPSAFGGFGVRQERCGEHLADWVDYVRKNNIPLPPPRWGSAKITDFSWLASQTVAEDLDLVLTPNVPPTKVA